jgi:hypothetical protein
MRVDLKELIALPSFRRFVWRLIDRTGWIAPVVQGDGIEMAAIRDGQRRIAIELVADLESVAPGTMASLMLAKAEADREAAKEAAKPTVELPEDE